MSDCFYSRTIDGKPDTCTCTMRPCVVEGCKDYETPINPLKLKVDKGIK